MLQHDDLSFDDSKLRPYGMSRRAIQNYKHNECEVVIVYGMPEGTGKSAYVNHCLADVGGYYSCKDWEKLKFIRTPNAERPPDSVLWDADYESAKPLIKYKPEDVVRWLKEIMIQGKRVPLWHWDDGGTWLNSMEFHDEFVIAFMQFLPLARTVCGLVVISTPVEEWVLKKLHTASGVIHAPVIKLAQNDDHPWRPRQCKAYRKQRWPNSNRYFPKYQWDDTFTAIMPDPFYRWYQPNRDHYARIAVEKMFVSIERKKKRGLPVGQDEAIASEMRENIEKANDLSLDLQEVMRQTVQEQR